MKLVFPHEAEVARAQEPLVCTGKPCIECFPCQLRLPPVSLGHAFAVYPDFSHSPCGTFDAIVRIDDLDHLAARNIAASDTHCDSRGFARHDANLVIQQGVTIDGKGHRALLSDAARRQQGDFRHAVTREKRFAAEAAGLED